MARNVNINHKKVRKYSIIWIILSIVIVLGMKLDLNTRLENALIILALPFWVGIGSALIKFFILRNSPEALRRLRGKSDNN